MYNMRVDRPPARVRSYFLRRKVRLRVRAHTAHAVRRGGGVRYRRHIRRRRNKARPRRSRRQRRHMRCDSRAVVVLSADVRLYRHYHVRLARHARRKSSARLSAGRRKGGGVLALAAVRTKDSRRRAEGAQPDSCGGARRRLLFLRQRNAARVCALFALLCARKAQPGGAHKFLVAVPSAARAGDKVRARRRQAHRARRSAPSGRQALSDTAQSR